MPDAPAHRGDATRAWRPATRCRSTPLMDTDPLDLDELAAQTSPDDLATMIYTSGTTGPREGGHARSAQRRVHRREPAPVHHVRTTTPARGSSRTSRWPTSPSGWSATTSRPCSGSRVTTALTSARSRPTRARCTRNVLFGVPRVWEKIYAGVNAALAGRTREEGAVRRRDRGGDPDRREEGVGNRDQGRAARRGTSLTPLPSAPCGGCSVSTSSTSPSRAQHRWRLRSSPGSARSACRSRRCTACPRAQAR